MKVSLKEQLKAIWIENNTFATHLVHLAPNHHIFRTKVWDLVPSDQTNSQSL